MKKFSTLAANLRVLFGVSRILVALFGIPLLLIWLILSFLPPVAKSPRLSLPLLNVLVKLPTEPSGKIELVSDASGLTIGKLKAEFLLKPSSTDAALTRAIRYTVFPGMVAHFIIAWFSLGILRNLCARAEIGEIFSDSNLRSIRNLGAFELLSVASDSGFSILTKLFLSPHLPAISFLGFNAKLRLDWLPDSFFSDLITGLLVLLLAEAFRQGLALKKENELTV